MVKIISIANNKGGVGKTTTTINLGIALAKSGKKVLLCDLDPQANTTIHLGLDITKLSKTIYNVLKGECSLKDIIQTSENVHIAPSHLNLSYSEFELIVETGREFILKNAIDMIKENYDYILIDCPPSLGILTLNAFTASSDVFIIAKLEPLALFGFNNILEVIKTVQLKLNKKLKLSGIIATILENTTIAKDVLQSLQENYNDLLFKTVIKKNVNFPESSALRKSIHSYLDKSNGALEYLELSNEVIMRG